MHSTLVEYLPASLADDLVLSTKMARIQAA